VSTINEKCHNLFFFARFLLILLITLQRCASILLRSSSNFKNKKQKDLNREKTALVVTDFSVILFSSNPCTLQGKSSA